MARSPLTFDAVTCASCGALVREDRVRCLRCGEPLVTASAAHERHSAALTKLLVAGAAVSAVALVGAVAFRPSAAPVAAAAVATKTAAPAVSRAERTEPKPSSEPLTSRDAIIPGQVAYASGDMTGAVQNFEHAVDANPDDPDALNNLAQALVRTGRARDAVPYLDRAIALEPDIWAYHFNRARALAQLEDWRGAVAGYRDALTLFPDDYATQYNLAKAQQKNGDLDAAIEGFERAIQLAPGQADFHLSHGLALEAAQRPKDAAAAYRRYLELAESPADADKVKERIVHLESNQGSPR